MTNRNEVTAMRQPRYTRSQDDVSAAWANLPRKLATQPFWLDHRQREGEWLNL